MAGFYPDVPAPRMAYDRDGTIMYYLSGTTPIEYGSSSLDTLNDESNSQFNIANGGGTRTRIHGFIFPEPRDIVGFYLALTTSASTLICDSFQTSTDTSNGYDGTWSNQTDVPNSSVIDGYRANIQSVNWPAIKAFRVRIGHQTGAASQNTYFRVCHIYGATSSFAGLDTLRMWHPTLDEPLDDNTSADGAYLDWGDVVRGTSADRTFRIKNNSATLTANSITVSSEVLTNTTPTLESQVTYSDGGAFASSINIGNLSPGAISPVITVRKATDLSATMSIWTLRTVVEAGSWS